MIKSVTTNPNASEIVYWAATEYVRSMGPFPTELAAWNALRVAAGRPREGQPGIHATGAYVWPRRRGEEP